MIRKADFKAAHQREGCEVGQAAETKQHTTHCIELTNDFSKQPPEQTESETTWGKDYKN